MTPSLQPRHRSSLVDHNVRPNRRLLLPVERMTAYHSERRKKTQAAAVIFVLCALACVVGVLAMELAR